MKFSTYVLSAVLILFCMNGFCADPDPIAVGEAFRFDAKVTGVDSLRVNWDIQPGFFRYKDRFNFRLLDPNSADLG